MIVFSFEKESLIHHTDSSSSERPPAGAQRDLRDLKETSKRPQRDLKDHVQLPVRTYNLCQRTLLSSAEGGDSTDVIQGGKLENCRE